MTRTDITTYLTGFVEKSIYAAAGVEETETRTFTYDSQSYESFEELPEIKLSYSLDKETAVIGPEDSLTLELTVSPSADFNVEWSSSDDTVALVDGQGTVTPVGAGLAVITARSGEYSAECTVTVAQEAEYRTEYYVREGNGSFSLYDSVNGSGPAGSIVSAEQKIIAGYSLSADYPASVTSGEITADGELTLKLYYEIDNVTVKSFANAAVPGDNAQYVSVIQQAMPEEYAEQARENTYLLEATSATAVSGVQPGAWGTRITIPFDSNDIGKYIIFSIYYTEHTVGDPSCYGEAVAWGQLNGGTELSLLNLGYGDRYNADYTLSEDPETGKWYNFVFLLESSQFEGAAFDISFSNYVDTEAYMGDILVMDGETLYNYYGSDTYAVEHYVRQADGSYQLKEKQDGLPASYNAAVSAEPVEIEGCTYNAAVSVASGNIPAKDKFALKLYYEDNRFAFDGVNNIDLGVTEALPKFDGADAGKSALCNFGDKKIVGGEKAREGIYYVGTGDGTFGATAQHKFTIHQDYLGKYIVIGAFYENITISTPDTSIKGKVLAWTAEGVPISPLNVYDAETGAVPAVTGEYGKWYDHVLYLDPASYTAGQVIGLTFAYHQNVEMYISGVSVLSSEAAAALGFVK